MKYLIVLLSVSTSAWSQKLPVVQAVSFKQDTFNILTYRTKADGVSLNTSAIAQAIFSRNKNGGGIVLIPKGFWLTGPIELKSNVNLHVSADAVLQFSDNPDNYPLVNSEMSGGARNLFVYDCNFLGTDIGIRFKTTRGRGGVVEKVFIRNIRMNNIGGAAILFDMYYMAKDPLTMFSGEDAPAIAFEPVNEGTPQFRDIHIRDVVCKGAETAIFIRGLPEMNIWDIEMENINIKSGKGFVCIEGDGITLRNANLDCGERTVVEAQNSKNLMLDNIRFRPSEFFIRVTGPRSRKIRVTNTAIRRDGKEISLGSAVTKDVISY